MRDHFHSLLQKLPGLLGVVLLGQIALCFYHSNPLANLEVPSVPHWHAEEPPVVNEPKTSETKSMGSTTIASAGKSNAMGTSIRVANNQVNGSNTAQTRAKNSQSSETTARPPSDILPVIQARINKITQSELLAPVFHPPPMALLGIAGRDAFLRTPNGQMSLLREGSESDGLKLLRIGTNRVLVEVAGDKKELMIFEGLGGESLLPK